jgi:hypothetical protein
MIMPTRHLAVSLALAVLSSSAIALGADDDDTAKPSKSPDGDENETDAKPPKPAVRAASSKGLEVPITDTREDPNRRYYFVGLRYRGTVIPKFLLNLFVDEGTTIYSNNVAIEFDMRKQGQSTIPWIMYSDYSMGDTLFLQKGQPMIPSNYTVVNSSLKVLYLGLDQLWSIPIDESHHWDFEFGFGVGVGLVFGSLQNDWVYPNSNGSLLASTGAIFSECVNTVPMSCQVGSHTGAQTAKVNGYKEPFWFSGGSVPNIFPYVSFPQFSVRYKPIKQLETRLGLGFSLTGFWFGLSADYGLESPDNSPKASSGLGQLHDML